MGIIPVGSCSMVKGSTNIGRGSRLGAGVGVEGLDVLVEDSWGMCEGVFVELEDKVRSDVFSGTRADVTIDVFTV